MTVAEIRDFIAERISQLEIKAKLAEDMIEETNCWAIINELEEILEEMER